MGWLEDTWRLEIERKDQRDKETRERYRYTIVGYDKQGNRLDYPYGSCFSRIGAIEHMIDVAQRIRKNHPCEAKWPKKKASSNSN